MKKKPLGKVRLTERRRRESYVWYVVYVLLITTLISGTAYVTRLPQFRVNDIEVHGTEFASAEEIETLTRDTLAASYVLLVPKDLMYIVPSGSIVERVASLPIVESASVIRDGQVLTVTVAERTPVARYCADTCYRMDAYGYIFDTVHDDGGLVAFRGGQLGVGDTYLDGRFHDVWDVVRGVQSVTGRSVREVLVDSADDVFVRFVSGGEVRTTLDPLGQKLLDDLAAILSSAKMAHDAQFEYIELRFGTKAAVKLVE